MLGDTTERTDGGWEQGGAARELAIQWVHGIEYCELQRLHGARLRVGRGAGSHLRLEHGSVSQDHVEFYRQGPIYALRDLGSATGTQLNGVRTEHAAVCPGDVIRVGEFVGVAMLVPGATDSPSFGELAAGLIGGPRLAAELVDVKAAAKSDVPVMLTGETGTGKERVARAIHEWSGRPGRFHALNCSALPSGLAEAELFGHERGAFTGAERSRGGHLRAAHRGTFFLDEAAELPLTIQAKLLRALEEQEVTPLGSTEAITVDARIIIAAHEPFDHYVAGKSFRADLYERLAGFQVHIPPLRARREEIPGLFRHLLEKHSARPLPVVRANLVERLLLHPWRGNVRELELFVRKLRALHGNDPVLGLEAADGILAGKATPPNGELSVVGARDRKDHDRLLLEKALVKHHGNMTSAAASIGISRRRAYRVLAGRESGDGADARANPPREHLSNPAPHSSAMPEE